MRPRAIIARFIVPNDTLELLLVDRVEADWTTIPFGMVRSIEVMEDARVTKDVTTLGSKDDALASTFVHG